MANDEPRKKNPIGATGKTVAANVKRLREDQRLAFTELAAILDRIGKPIPTLGLRHIEAEKRRVDSDDLVALAVALGVTPAALLMPGEYPNGARIDALDTVHVTGVEEPVMAINLWHWLTATDSLEGDINLFIARSWPHWQRYAWNQKLESERKKMQRGSVTNGDD